MKINLNSFNFCKNLPKHATFSRIPSTTRAYPPTLKNNIRDYFPYHQIFWTLFTQNSIIFGRRGVLICKVGYSARKRTRGRRDEGTEGRKNDGETAGAILCGSPFGFRINIETRKRRNGEKRGDGKMTERLK
jgi:hypothetical protein